MNVKKSNMLTRLRYFHITFSPFHIMNLHMYLRFHKVNWNEGDLGKKLHKTIIQSAQKRYFMHGTIHLFIVECTSSYEITYIPIGTVRRIYK
jgi:hypothetical protein